MRTNTPWFILAALLAAVPATDAFAEAVKRSSKTSSSDEEDDESSGTEDIDEGTMLRNQAPRLEGLPEEDGRVGLRETLQEQYNRPYDNVVYRGAEVL